MIFHRTYKPIAFQGRAMSHVVCILQVLKAFAGHIYE